MKVFPDIFTFYYKQTFSIVPVPVFNVYFTSQSPFYRGSRPEVFYKKGVLKDFAKFIGKQLCQTLFFNKVGGRLQFQLRASNLKVFFCFPFFIININTFVDKNNNHQVSITLCTTDLKKQEPVQRGY